MSNSGSTTARLLAPLALILATVAIVIVVAGSLGDDGGGDKGSKGAKQERQARSKKPPKDYTVEPGDTLSSISQQFGVPVDVIEQLNPDVDPQALASGEKLKLR